MAYRSSGLEQGLWNLTCKVLSPTLIHVSELQFHAICMKVVPILVPDMTMGT